ncbi:flagellar assembly protein FliW [Candidatus Sumerlaeota bacterium]|nr:flagellar assembly protein FliW [Candidatus Sumerlaeota bacterium]
MRFQTTRFGDLEVDDQAMLKIHGGILGFPQQQRYVILEHDTSDNSPFKWLQSVDEPSLAFVVIDPRLLTESYQLELDAETAELLGSVNPADFIPMVIVKIPRDHPEKMTANLRGPIIVRETSREGCQIVLTDEGYPFDHQIFPDAAQTAGVR